MPIDYQVLAAFGTTNERLKEIFTAVRTPDLDPQKGESKEERKVRLERKRQNDKDIQTRERFRYKVQTRVEEGIVNSMRNWKKYAAVDLAWDSSILSGMTLPLQMYAQGKINVERAVGLLKQVPGGEQYIKKVEADQITVDVPRFIETNINLIRSVITRRHGAQKCKYNELWPYYKYEARSTGLAAKCRADVLSQRVDMMADQFDYRHHDAQVIRDGFLYGHVLDFVRSPWEVEYQLERKQFDGPADDAVPVIVKEGVGFTNPHPSRIFWDNSAPHGLASINSDDIGWVGFWDVIRFSEIDDNPDYFNKASVGWTGRFWGDAGVYNTYKDYFTHYQYTIIPPASGEIDPSKANDRKSIVGFYSGNQRDASVFYSNYFERLVPKDYGIGEYPYPVWVRLVTASDSTVIFAEIMPSTPAAFLGINESDARQVNVSMAMDLFAFQDQMTNLATHLMLLCQMELFKAIGLNTDLLTPEQVAAARRKLGGRNWFSEPLILEYSLAKMQEMGFNTDKVIQIAETHQGASISSIFEAMIRLVEMVEKLMALSPNEQGQPAPREISATEVNEISNTTSSVYSSISDDIDEWRSAKKRIIYDALVSCSKGQVECPVKDRYTPKTIAAAGFSPKESEAEDYGADPDSPRRWTVIGSKRQLVHAYIFTTRDGAERPVNTQAANTLVQLIGQALSVPAISQAMGKEKLYELFNEVFRLSGAGVDLNLTLKEGEDDTLGQDEIGQMKQTLDQLTQYLQQMAGQLQKNAQDIQQIEQLDADQQTAIEHLTTLAQQMQKASNDINDLRGRHEEISKRLQETISYKDCPPSIRRQMEMQAGFRPASQSEHDVELMAAREAAKPKPKTTTK